MRTMLMLAAFVMVITAGLWAVDSCPDASKGLCCDCTSFVGGTCKEGFYNCACRCTEAMGFCINSGGPCSQGNCQLVPAGITPDILSRFPWMATDGIVEALAKNSVMPDAWTVYDFIQSQALKKGPKYLSGLVMPRATDPKLKVKGPQWFGVISDDAERVTRVTLYYDPENKYHRWAEIHHANPSVTPTETVTFYLDRWEQVNANGTFKGKVDAFSKSLDAAAIQR
jgi:hypothetical protein